MNRAESTELGISCELFVDQFTVVTLEKKVVQAVVVPVKAAGAAEIWPGIHCFEWT